MTVPPITATGLSCVLRALGESVNRLRRAKRTTIGSTIGTIINGIKTAIQYNSSVVIQDIGQMAKLHLENSYLWVQVELYAGLTID